MSTSTSDAATKRGRRELIGLALVCIAPVAASYFLYYGWQPSRFKNYGDLIPLAPVAALAPVPKAAPVDDLAALRGKWLLVMTDAGACEKSCRDKLWQLRQLRLTQGKEMDRIVRVWLVDDAAAVRPLDADYEGTVVLPRSRFPELANMPAPASPRDHLYVIDPIGNLMMRFPKDADLNRVKKDLIHLLKASQIG
jgi:hypothetical protein